MERDINVKERRNALIERRGYDLSDFDIKYRGRLKTTKYMIYEAAQKRQLFSGWKRG